MSDPAILMYRLKHRINLHMWLHDIRNTQLQISEKGTNLFKIRFKIEHAGLS